jgi:hypothetical protein
MVQRVSRGQNNNADFEITESLCLAINNIDYVLQYIQPFVNVSASLWKDKSKKRKVSRLWNIVDSGVGLSCWPARYKCKSVERQ